ELARGGGAAGPSADGAGAGREPGLVDELDRHVAGQQLTPVEADPSASRKARAVEVVETGVQDRAAAAARGLERGDPVRPERGDARGQVLGCDGRGQVQAVLG